MRNIVSNVNCPRRRLRVQKGVILIVALVMLLVMTIVGVTTMTGATLQERIAGNQRQRAVARINADQALRVAEAYLDGLHGARSLNTGQLIADFSGGGTVDDDGLYTAVSFQGGGVLKPLSLDRTDEGAWTVDYSIAVPSELNVSARYVIEYLGSVTSGTESFELNNDRSGGASSETEGKADGQGGRRKSFRITAIGYGNNANVVSVLESYYLEAAQQ